MPQTVNQSIRYIKCKKKSSEWEEKKICKVVKQGMSNTSQNSWLDVGRDPF